MRKIDEWKKAAAIMNKTLCGPPYILGKAFSNLFKSYALAINKRFGRTGQLFEEVFRRKEIENDDYLRWLVFYIHANPQLHGFLSDFRLYAHSSYSTLLSDKPTRLSREQTLSLYGDRNGFVQFHDGQLSDSGFSFDL